MEEGGPGGAGAGGGVGFAGGDPRGHGANAMPLARAPKAPEVKADCWFCLSSPSVATYLIARSEFVGAKTTGVLSLTCACSTAPGAAVRMGD